MSAVSAATAAPAAPSVPSAQKEASKRFLFLAQHMPVKVLEKYFGKDSSKWHIETRSAVDQTILGGYSQHSRVSDTTTDGKRTITFRILRADEKDASITIVHFKSWKQCAQVFKATFSFSNARFNNFITDPRPGLPPYTNDVANDYAIHCIEEAMTCKGLGADEYAYQDDETTPNPEAARILNKALHQIESKSDS